MEKETFHLSLQLRHRRQQRFGPRVDDDGPLRIQPIEREADSLPHAPLDAIAHHGLPKGARNRKADPRPARFRLADAKGGK